MAALTAWNSPLLFVAWKCAPALAAGCSVVVKPSEFASASALEFAALTKEAGVPDGVFNVVTGFGTRPGARLSSTPMSPFTFTDRTRPELELRGCSPRHQTRFAGTRRQVARHCFR